MKAEFEMNTATWILLGLVAIIVIMGLYYIGIYNSLVMMDVTVDDAWANIETTYQRRFDLIPNLVNTVKGYMEHESSLFKEIVALRSQWQASTTQEEYIESSSALDSAIGRLLLVYENYPDLKAVEPVNNLMVQLEGTENRIAVARRDYNGVVKNFNTAIRSFPSNMVAGMMGLSQSKLFFEAKEGANEVPVINF